ncbi:MAG: putative diguanylate cyclase/phosphodiesterase with sensor [Actinomycetia bacterium]|nr:putative diguanylate cyclase/phosphodiesterase with sensor [Actinomycetes bacterium]
MQKGTLRTRIGPFLPYLGGPAGALGFWLMDRAHLLGSTPYWVILTLLVGTAIVNAGAYFVAQRLKPGAVRRNLRLAIAAATTTVIIYATGWGPVIAIGYVLGLSDVLRTDGSKAWSRGVIWSIGGIALGQLAIATHIAPTVLSPHVSLAVAAANATCLTIVMYSVGSTAAVAERATLDVGLEREHFRSLVAHATDVIAVIGSDLSIEYASPAIESLLGLTPEECIGMTIGDVLGIAEHERAAGLAERLEQVGRTFTTEMQMQHRDGSPRTVEVTATLRDDGTIVTNIHDVTQQRALERELRFQASHDKLTGLKNRAALIEAVEKHTINEVVVDTISVLFVDLDGFKEVNDALGHERGDSVLVEAARRIVGAVPSHALAGRLGGDEFLVVLPGTANDEAGAIALHILDALGRPWHLPGKISASIGVATTGRHPESVEDILRRADEAMYDAKRQGKGRFVLAAAG